MSHTANEDEENTEIYGASLKYDSEFKGPRKRRSCTDIIFLIIFLVFLVAWAAVAFYAFKNGKPSTLFNPVDSQGRRCGQDSEVINKKYLFFFDLSKCATPKVLLNGCDTPQICVEECPRLAWSSKPYIEGTKQFNLNEVQNNLICTDESTKNNINTKEKLKDSVVNGQCADWYISSTPVHGRCLGFIGNFKDLKWNIFLSEFSQYILSLRDWLSNYPEGEEKYYEVHQHD